MAASDESCDGNPDFAIICSFITKFGNECGVNVTIPDLQQMLEDTKNAIHEDLAELHIHLLRRGRKRVTKEKWEKSLIKFCHEYSSVDAWELERFGYKKAKLSVKLELLKRLLELQFDSNAKFKSEVNKHEAQSLRIPPVGRDIDGQMYWYQLDKEYNLRLYRQGPEEEGTWQLLCSTTDHLKNLLSNLQKNITKDTPLTNTSSTSSDDMDTKKLKMETDCDDLTSRISDTKPTTIIIKSEKKESTSNTTLIDKVKSSDKSDKEITVLEQETHPPNKETSSVQEIKSENDQDDKMDTAEVEVKKEVTSNNEITPMEVDDSKLEKSSKDEKLCPDAAPKSDVEMTDVETDGEKTRSSAKDKDPSEDASTEKQVINKDSSSTNKSPPANTLPTEQTSSEDLSMECSPIKTSGPSITSTEITPEKEPRPHLASPVEETYKGGKIKLYEKWSNERKQALSSPNAKQISATPADEKAVDRRESSGSSVSKSKTKASQNYEAPMDLSVSIRSGDAVGEGTSVDLPSDLTVGKKRQAMDHSRASAEQHLLAPHSENSASKCSSNISEAPRPFKKKHLSKALEESSKEAGDLSRKSVIFEVKSNKLLSQFQDKQSAVDSSVKEAVSANSGFSHLQALQNMCNENPMMCFQSSVIRSASPDKRLKTDSSLPKFGQNSAEKPSYNEATCDKLSQKYMFSNSQLSGDVKHFSETDVPTPLLKSNVQSSEITPKESTSSQQRSSSVFKSSMPEVQEHSLHSSKSIKLSSESDNSGKQFKDRECPISMQVPKGDIEKFSMPKKPSKNSDHSVASMIEKDYKSVAKPCLNQRSVNYCDNHLKRVDESDHSPLPVTDQNATTTKSNEKSSIIISNAESNTTVFTETFSSKKVNEPALDLPTKSTKETDKNIDSKASEKHFVSIAESVQKPSEKDAAIPEATVPINIELKSNEIVGAEVSNLSCNLIKTKSVEEVPMKSQISSTETKDVSIENKPLKVDISKFQPCKSNEDLKESNVKTTDCDKLEKNSASDMTCDKKESKSLISSESKGLENKEKDIDSHLSKEKTSLDTLKVNDENSTNPDTDVSAKGTKDLKNVAADSSSTLSEIKDKTCEPSALPTGEELDKDKAESYIEENKNEKGLSSISSKDNTNCQKQDDSKKLSEILPESSVLSIKHADQKSLKEAKDNSTKEKPKQHLDDEDKDKHLEKEAKAKHLEEEAKEKHSEKVAKNKHPEEEVKDKHSEEEVKDKHSEGEAKDKHLDEEAKDKHLDEEAKDKHLDGEAKDEHLDEEAKDKHLEKEAKAKHLEEEAEDKHSEEEVKDKHLDEVAKDNSSETKTKQLEEKAKDKPSEEKAKDKPPEEKAKDKHSEEKAEDKHSEEKAKDKPSEEKAQDKHCEEKSRDKPSEEKAKQHLEEKAKDEHSKEKAKDDHLKEKAKVKHSEETAKDKHSEEKAKDKPPEETGNEEKDKHSEETGKEEKDKHSEETGKEEKDKHSEETAKEEKDKHSEEKAKDKHSEEKAKDKHSEEKAKDKHSEEKAKDKHSEEKAKDKHLEKKVKEKHSGISSIHKDSINNLDTVSELESIKDTKEINDSVLSESVSSKVEIDSKHLELISKGETSELIKSQSSENKLDSVVEDDASRKEDCAKIPSSPVKVDEDENKLKSHSKDQQIDSSTCVEEKLKDQCEIENIQSSQKNCQDELPKLTDVSVDSKQIVQDGNSISAGEAAGKEDEAKAEEKGKTQVTPEKCEKPTDSKISTKKQKSKMLKSDKADDAEKDKIRTQSFLNEKEQKKDGSKIEENKNEKSVGMKEACEDEIKSLVADTLMEVSEKIEISKELDTPADESSEVKIKQSKESKKQKDLSKTPKESKIKSSQSSSELLNKEVTSQVESEVTSSEGLKIKDSTDHPKSSKKDKESKENKSSPSNQKSNEDIADSLTVEKDCLPSKTSENIALNSEDSSKTKSEQKMKLKINVKNPLGRYFIMHSSCLESKMRHPGINKLKEIPPPAPISKPKLITTFSMDTTDDVRIIHSVNDPSPTKKKRGRLRQSETPAKKPTPAKTGPKASPKTSKKPASEEKGVFNIPEGFLEILSNAKSEGGSAKKEPQKKPRGRKLKINAPSLENSESESAPIKRSSRIKTLQQKKMSELAVEMEREQRILEQMAKKSGKKGAQLKTPIKESETKPPRSSKKFQPSTPEDSCMELKRTPRKMNSRSRNITKMHLLYEDESKDSEFSTSRETEKSKKRRRGRGANGKKGYKPWDVSSESETTHEELTEEEEEEEEEREEPLVFVVNDDEFACEEVDEDEEVVVVRRARTAKKVPEDTTIEDAVINDDKPCSKCGKYDKPEWILLCDKCDNGYHTNCLIPPLMIIPEGDWYCAPCEHIFLCEWITKELHNLEVVLKQREREELRKQRLAYVGISLDNVLKPEKKEESDEEDEAEKESESEEEVRERRRERKSRRRETSSSEEEERIEKLYGKRSVRARGTVNYQFKEYDELIASAIGDEIPAVKAEEPSETKVIDDDEENDSDKAFQAKFPKKKKRKTTRLNDLDASDDEDSGEEYKGSSNASDSEQSVAPSHSEGDSAGSGEWKIVRTKGKKPKRKARRGRRDDSDEDWDEEEDDDTYRPVTRRAAQKNVSYREISSDDEWDPKPKAAKKRKKSITSEDSEASYKKKKPKTYSTTKKKKRVRKWASSDSSEESERSIDFSESSGSGGDKWKVKKSSSSQVKVNINKKVLSSEEEESQESAPKKKPNKIVSDEEESEDEEEDEEEEDEEEGSSEEDDEEEEPKTKVTKPDVKVTKPDVKVTKPEVKVTKPEVSANKPEVKALKPEVKDPKTEANPSKELVKPEVTKVSVPMDHLSEAPVEPIREKVVVSMVQERPPQRTVKKDATKMVPCVIPYDKSPKSAHGTPADEESDKDARVKATPMPAPYKNAPQPPYPQHPSQGLPPPHFPRPPMGVIASSVAPPPKPLMNRPPIPERRPFTGPIVQPFSNMEEDNESDDEVPLERIPTAMPPHPPPPNKPPMPPYEREPKYTPAKELPGYNYPPPEEKYFPPTYPHPPPPFQDYSRPNPLKPSHIETYNRSSPSKLTTLDSYNRASPSKLTSLDAYPHPGPKGYPLKPPSHMEPYERSSPSKLTPLDSYSHAGMKGAYPLKPTHVESYERSSPSKLTPLDSYSQPGSTKGIYPLKPSLVETYERSSPSKLTSLDSYPKGPYPLKPTMVETYNRASPSKLTPLDSYSRSGSPKSFVSLDSYPKKKQQFYGNPEQEPRDSYQRDIGFPPEPTQFPPSPNVQRDTDTPPRFQSQYPDNYSRSPEYYNSQYYQGGDRSSRPAYPPGYGPSNPYVATPVPQPNGGFMIDTLLRARNPEDGEDELTGVTDIVSYITQE